MTGVSPLAVGAVFILSTVLFGGKSVSYELSHAKLFPNALAAVEKHYVDPSRINYRKMMDGATHRMQTAVPEILIKEVSPEVISVTVGLAEKRFRVGNNAGPDDLKEVFSQIFKFISENLRPDTKPEEVEYAAIDGMLEVLDPHSNFMPPKVYNEFKVGTRGKFGGLGIVISIKDGMLSVIAPIEGTPASGAGIRAGDKILQIDDESTINMSLTDAVNKLRGDVGSKVAIVVERAGKPARRILLTRAIINIDSVQSRLLTEGAKKIGYIKVKNFQANTDDDVAKALKEFHKNAAPLGGLILDLRNNPGGLLNVAVDVTDHFLKKGTIVSTVGANDEILEKENASGEGTEPDYPVMVLINEGSASASEIVAGALQANNRAAVMGRRSFGKGSVQTIYELGEGSALKITIAQYKPAGTESIQLNGVVPDIDLQPVIIDKKQMNMIDDILPSEEYLDQHFERSGEKVSTVKSAYTVKYFKPAETEKDIEAQSAREYSKQPDIEKDFAVELARKLLLKSSGESRPALLGSVSGPVKTAQESEQTTINNALKLVGIDWASTKTDGNPALKLSYNLYKNGAEIKRAKAGEKVDLTFRATNVGSGDYSRLIAVGQSDMPFLSNIEFPFGKIAPGQTKAWSAPIEFPEGLPKENIIMDVTFEEGNNRKPAALAAFVPVDELPEPVFEFGFTLPTVGKGKPFATGVSIPVNLTVTNVGSGTTSAETTATISNECGEKLFVENGRTKLGVIRPKSSRNAIFKFHLSSNFDAAPCYLKLTIADLKRYVVLTKKIELYLKEGDTKPIQGQKYAPPVIEVADAPSSTPGDGVSIFGTIKDTDPVRDYFVFVDDKKIVYTPNLERTNTMKFSFTAPLKGGNNNIVIGARDEADITTRKIVVVERTTGERKKKQPRSQVLGAGE